MDRHGPTAKLAAHPRLYIGAAEIARLRGRRANDAVMRAAAAVLAADTPSFLRSTDIPFDVTRHNSLLIRARLNQKRILSLLVNWLRTGAARYRNAAMAHVRAMGQWDYWSWIAWRRGDRAPDAIFDLCYGENSATLAIAYDLMHAQLTREELRIFLGLVRRWPVASFIKNAASAWWFASPQSNWNAVCAGGAGLLALAFYDELPVARRILALAEKSLRPFMLHLDTTRGGWPEGVGYWNYGMRYAFMYLLSWERAHGRSHPLMRRAAVRHTLSFPLDFSPYGAACGFGDSNAWVPLPFHFAAAARLRDASVVSMLRTAIALNFEAAWNHGAWPNAAEMLLLYPPGALPWRRPAGAGPVARIYGRLGWGVLADRLPAPRFHLSARGGTTEVPHGHKDLFSFNCVVDGEPLLCNLANREYLDTTFSARRYELIEVGPAGKNTLLINGVGIAKPAQVRIRTVTGKACHGLLMDGAAAMGESRDRWPAARFCARLLLLTDHGMILCLDRVVLPAYGRLEARFFTPCAVKVRHGTAALRGVHANARMVFAADVPAILSTAVPALTTPQPPPPTMLRWCSIGLHEQMVFATLITPGLGGSSVELNRVGGNFRVVAGHGRDRFSVMVKLDMMPVRPEVSGRKWGIVQTL